MCIKLDAIASICACPGIETGDERRKGGGGVNGNMFCNSTL